MIEIIEKVKSSDLSAKISFKSSANKMYKEIKAKEPKEPKIKSSNVVLPAPEGPTIAALVPESIFKLIFSSANPFSPG